MSDQVPGVGKAKRGKGPRGKRELAKKRAAIEAAKGRIRARKALGLGRPLVLALLMLLGGCVGKAEARPEVNAQTRAACVGVVDALNDWADQRLTIAQVQDAYELARRQALAGMDADRRNPLAIKVVTATRHLHDGWHTRADLEAIARCAT